MYLTIEDLPNHTIREASEIEVEHSKTKVVATCTNCRDLVGGESKAWRSKSAYRFKHNKEEIPGNPVFCPECGFALFYERVLK